MLPMRVLLAAYCVLPTARQLEHSGVSCFKE